ncbi:flavin reductase family protein [Phytomonospora endophytica]|uniref:Flavin reductase (DIM6/NTAB) family NADH-FMN oxidoreductase RutF n=1 Tax=Phytomonospora endophytica TaxID=714109 RepID=A0A841FLZ1_9ACTN|nr:flavin reductase family protein [Phytomonospora endophytica]MBB6037015.1 flavin reductase (DIM6/NTAB) family NADH-FMN oxidoreductase RutF [Phytomonospora endophytica]GIG69441.1 flavin-dependent reductase [Phytomonospora endophytica]
MTVATRPELDAATFRSVFRTHAAAVAIITADDGHGPVGFTATSLTSVSLTPPLVSFALSTVASSWPAVAVARSLVVHLLDSGQHELARRFATSGIDRFAAPTRWSRLDTGEPALDEAPIRLRGLVEHRYPAGDHHIVVVRLTAADVARPHSPLIYHGGSYASLT